MSDKDESDEISGKRNRSIGTGEGGGSQQDQYASRAPSASGGGRQAPVVMTDGGVDEVVEEFEEVEPGDSGWVPYENEYGETGWRELDTGEVVSDSTPPGGFENVASVRELSEENPLQEGERVRFETTDGYGFGEIHTVQSGRALIVKDEGGTTRVSESGGGPRDVTALDTPYSDKLDPESLTPQSADDVAYLLDEAEDFDAQADVIREAAQNDVSTEEISDAVAEENEAWGVLSNELLKSPTSDGDIALKPELTTSDDELEEEFAEEYGFDTHEDVNIIKHGWEGRMFERRSAPVLKEASERTGNERMPGFDFPENLSEDEVESAQQHWDFVEENLREEFGEEITVYRGLTTQDHSYQADGASETPVKLREAKENGEQVEMPHRTLESWSTDPFVAASYASGEENDGVVLERKVPVDRVAMSAGTGYLLDDDAEIVVAHDEEHQYDSDQIHKSESLTNRKKFELTVESVSDVNDSE